MSWSALLVLLRMNFFPTLLIPLLSLLAVTSAPGAESKEDGILIDHVWSGHPVPFAMLVERGHQFIAYYNADRRITVVGRKLGETTWSRFQPDGVPVPRRNRPSNQIGWDSHNSLQLALDADGHLHLSGNMHADPLVYYRTRQPWDVTSLERLDRMTGEREDRVTYPNFFTNAAGELVFRYRDGGSGNGNDYYNIYNRNTRTWRRLLDTPLHDGEGERNVYSTAPVLGPDGYFHIVWVWRETPDAATNHSLSYARSRDLVLWETHTGARIPLPITLAKSDVIDAAKPGEGLINMCRDIGFDPQGRPVAVYHRYDAQGNSQAFVARPDGSGRWVSQAISDWTFRWAFGGGGSIAGDVRLGRPTPQPDGTVMVDYGTRAAGSGRFRLDGRSLAVIAKLPPAGEGLPAALRAPRAGFPGAEVQTMVRRADGRTWILRWETQGRNRDKPHETVPPASELRLYEIPGQPQR